RGRAMIPLSGKGATASVQLPAAEVERELVRAGGRLSIAAVNSPSSTTVAGPVADVEALVRELEAKRVPARLLRLDFASHCSLVDPIREELLGGLAGLAPRPGDAAFYSSVSASKLTGAELDAAYWYQNVREPVRFLDAVCNLLDDGYVFF